MLDILSKRCVEYKDELDLPTAMVERAVAARDGFTPDATAAGMLNKTAKPTSTPAKLAVESRP